MNPPPRSRLRGGTSLSIAIAGLYALTARSVVISVVTIPVSITFGQAPIVHQSLPIIHLGSIAD